VSGSKDTQQPIKLWDARSGVSVATLYDSQIVFSSNLFAHSPRHAHKNTVTDVKWNRINGNWLLTGSRDNLIKVFDIRNMRSEMAVFRGHKSEVSCLAWHPIHESFFVSGSGGGELRFWVVE